ncbi:hypothetical protein KSP35_10990 [Aquihabitans sp. G128]|uniref:hypothetical protein n=1 Tax=Aquihabitans sp. G128 TaxID=2849779 RepID=UPI001C2322A9|nr:hypothetical protein [Aquihabitans sp. G128]QXC63259.1 hypothetical protein KSP35_10990 [Aquihabitans sp. G128]
MLVLVILAVVWAAVLIPPFVRNRRDGRPDNSVVSFRAQLSTLERATPGTSLRTLGTAPHGGPALPLTMNRGDAKRRRRDVLVGLLGATAFTLLLAVVVGGTLVTLLFLASGGALSAYVYALRQMKLRTMERVAKVRPLTTVRSSPAPVLAMRRTAN